MPKRPVLATCGLVMLATMSARAQPASGPASPDKAEGRQAAPSSLVILFGEGSSRLGKSERSTLDRASRAYNEGRPIVMTITGTADRSGNAVRNLRLSQQRANIVLQGLLDRGIPADRFQVLAKGETELPVPTPQGKAEPENRRVVISWH